MAKEPFVAISKIIRNGPYPFAEIVFQPEAGEFSGVRAPSIRIELPVKSINLSAEEQAELEQAIRDVVDWDAIVALAEKAR